MERPVDQEFIEFLRGNTSDYRTDRYDKLVNS